MTWKSWRKYAAPLLEYGSYFVPVGSVAVGMYKAAEQMQQDEAKRVAEEGEKEKAIAAVIEAWGGDPAEFLASQMQNSPMTDEKLARLQARQVGSEHPNPIMRNEDLD